MTTFLLRLITPDGELYHGRVQSVVAPGSEGFLGVMAHHAPILAALKPDVLTVRGEDGTTRYFAVGEGVLEVYDNVALLLVDGALPASTPEEARAKLAEIVPTFSAARG